MSKRRMLLGLIGANIMGSLSPALFAEAFAASGIDGFYQLIDVDRQKERRLPQLLDAIKATGFSGTNVTYPFKQDILPLLDAIDPEAAQIGAINTIAIAPDGRDHRVQFRPARLAPQLRGNSRPQERGRRNRRADRRRRRGSCCGIRPDGSGRRGARRS